MVDVQLLDKLEPVRPRRMPEARLPGIAEQRLQESQKENHRAGADKSKGDLNHALTLSKKRAKRKC